MRLKNVLLISLVTFCLVTSCSTAKEVDISSYDNCTTSESLTEVCQTTVTKESTAPVTTVKKKLTAKATTQAVTEVVTEDTVFVSEITYPEKIPDFISDRPYDLSCPFPDFRDSPVRYCSAGYYPSMAKGNEEKVIELSDHLHSLPWRKLADNTSEPDGEGFWIFVYNGGQNFTIEIFGAGVVRYQHDGLNEYYQCTDKSLTRMAIEVYDFDGPDSLIPSHIYCIQNGNVWRDDYNNSEPILFDKRADSGYAFFLPDNYYYKKIKDKIDIYSNDSSNPILSIGYADDLEISRDGLKIIKGHSWYFSCYMYYYNDSDMWKYCVTKSLSENYYFEICDYELYNMYAEDMDFIVQTFKYVSESDYN